MAIDKSDSSLIREYYEELVDALTSSKPARESLAIKLFAKNVLCHSEKQEIMNDSGSAMSLADKLVGYIINRIDSQVHCSIIWKELHSVEALTDILKRIKSKGGTYYYYDKNSNYVKIIILYLTCPYTQLIIICSSYNCPLLYLYFVFL